MTEEEHEYMRKLSKWSFLAGQKHALNMLHMGTGGPYGSSVTRRDLEIGLSNLGEVERESELELTTMAEKLFPDRP